jgi:hypothetical protein
MKNLITFIAILFLSLQVNAQNKVAFPDSTKKIETVETSCGQCQFALKDKKGCDLAVRINGKAYFVEGTKIDDHGDAHAKDGFCEAIRKAEVQGTVVNNKFKVTYYKLLPLPKEKE